MFIFPFGGQVIQKNSISPSVHVPDLARMGKMDLYKSCTLLHFVAHHGFCLIRGSLSTVMFPTGATVPCLFGLRTRNNDTHANNNTHGPVSLRFLAMKTRLIITGGGFCEDQRSRSCSPIESPSPLRLHEST